MFVCVYVHKWIGSFLLLSRPTQHNIPHMVDLLIIDDEFGVRGVDLLGLLEVFGSCLIILEGLVCERPPKVRVGVLGLHLYDRIEIHQRLVILAHQQVTLGSFVHVTRLILLELHGSREWLNGLLEELQVGERNAQVVVNVGFVRCEGLILERLVQVLDAVAVLLVLVERQTAFVVDLGVVGFAVQSER